MKALKNSLVTVTGIVLFVGVLVLGGLQRQEVRGDDDGNNGKAK